MRRLGACAAMIAASAPAVAGNLAMGRQLYASHCQSCHGVTGEGDDMTPDIRGLPKTAVRRAAGGMGAMPEFQLDADDVEALTLYLDRLDGG